MLKVHLKPVKVLERVYICGVTQFKGSEKFDERFWMLGCLLLWVNTASKGVYETSYIWKYSVQLACIFII